MPLVEKHGGLWLNDAADAGTWPVYERYDPEVDLVAVVVRSPSGYFVASLFEKVSDPQWRLPFWDERQPGASFDDEPSAVAHAEALVQAASGS